MLRLTTIFVFVSLIFSIVYSQEKVNYANLKSMRKDGEFVRFQVEDFNPKSKNKYDKSKTYYWYKSQNVMSTQGGSSGLLLDGIYERFYSNKQLAVKGFYKKGLKHGAWTYWNEQGRLMKEEQWRKGKPKNTTLVYDKKGNLKKERDHRKQEVVHSSDQKIIKTNIDSTEVEIIEKYKNGQTKSVSRYQHDELHGKQLRYDEKGSIIELSSYKNGVLHGKQIEEDGTTTTYKNGEEKTPLLKRIFNHTDKEKIDESVKNEESDEDSDEEEGKESKSKKKRKRNNESNSDDINTFRLN